MIKIEFFFCFFNGTLYHLAPGRIQSDLQSILFLMVAIMCDKQLHEVICELAWGQLPHDAILVIHYFYTFIEHMKAIINFTVSDV